MMTKPAAVVSSAARFAGLGGYPCNASATRKNTQALHIAMKCTTAASRAGESCGSPMKSNAPAIIANKPEAQPSASDPAASCAASSAWVTLPTTSATTAQVQNTMGKCTNIGCTG